MRGVLALFLIALALWPVGCTSPQKKKSPRRRVNDACPPIPTDRSGPTTVRRPLRSPARIAIPVNTPDNDPEVSGILAGRIIDSYQRPGRRAVRCK